MAEQTSHPRVGERIGKYEIRGVLGQGAMGTVFDGWDPLIGRRVAVKTVKLSGSREQVRDALARFRQGAQAAGRLNHPNIVAVFDYGEAEDYAYIVMELVNGRPLDGVLEEEGRLPRARVLAIMDDVLAALSHSHQHRVIHRDIKPANIMITADGRAKVTDFGVARIEDSGMTMDGTVIGAPAYMSPEQMTGDVADARSDIYSTGVLLYELLTGKRPFEGSLTAIMHKALNTDRPRPSATVSADPTLDEAVARAMARDPADRFQDAAAFARALHESRDAGETVVLPRLPEVRPPAGGTVAPKPAPHRGPSPVLIGVAALVLLAALGGGGWYAFLRGGGNSGVHSRFAGVPSEPVGQVPPASADLPPGPNQDRTDQPAPLPPAIPAPDLPPSPAEPPSEVVGSAKPGDNAGAEQPAPPLPPSPVPGPVPAPVPLPTPTPSRPGASPSAPVTHPTADQPAPAPVPPPPAPLQPEGPVASSGTRPTPGLPQPAPPAPPGPIPQPVQPPSAPAPRNEQEALLQPPRPPTPAARPVGVVLGILGSTLPQVDCTLTRATPDASGGVAVHGVGGGADPLGRLREATDRAGAGPLQWDVRPFNATAAHCEALDLLRPYTRAVDPSATAFRVQRAAGPDVLRQGDLLKLNATMPEFPGYLRIDVLQSDGQLSELYPPSNERDVPFRARESARLGEPSGTVTGWEVGPPFGTDLVVAIASDTRLFAGSRTRRGSTVADYLRDLRRALADLRARGNRVEVDAVPVMSRP